MQIHHMLVAVNQIDRLEPGAILTFNQTVALIEAGDAIIARFSDGSEQLMIVRRVSVSSVFAEITGDAKRQVQLEQSGPRSLKIVG